MSLADTLRARARVFDERLYGHYRALPQGARVVIAVPFAVAGAAYWVWAGASDAVQDIREQVSDTAGNAAGAFRDTLEFARTGQRPDDF